MTEREGHEYFVSGEDGKFHFPDPEKEEHFKVYEKCMRGALHILTYERKVYEDLFIQRVAKTCWFLPKEEIIYTKERLPYHQLVTLAETRSEVASDPELIRQSNPKHFTLINFKPSPIDDTGVIYTGELCRDPEKLEYLIKRCTDWDMLLNRHIVHMANTVRYYQRTYGTFSNAFKWCFFFLASAPAIALLQDAGHSYQ